MEILNSIWNALCTENETMIKIISIPAIIIEIYLSFCIFTLILKTNCTKTQKKSYILFISIASIVSNLLIPTPFNVIINYLFIFIILKLYFKFTFIQTVIAIIIPFAVFGLSNSLIMNPFLKIFKISFETASDVPIYRILYTSCTYIVIFFVLQIFNYKKWKIPFSNNIDKKTRNIILINLILGILTLIIQATLTVYYVSTVPIIFTLFNFALLFAYIFTSFYSLTKAMKLDIATRDLENAESYNNSLTVLYDNVKGFKHDFDNMVNIIGGYIQVNDIEGLKKYYDSLEKDCARVNNIRMLNPNIINNPGIYNLIVSKYKKATDLDININFEFFFDFENLHMPIYEFSRILGILLDNAIEAAKECEEKQINLIFRESRKQHVQLVIIENTYMNKDIDTKQIFEKGISGKENHSGIGLWEVNNIVKKNNNIVLNTTKDENYFKQELQIYF